jgi:predicted RNA-binding Zn-ribbon protein involved in translation (DUF1610 family)
MKKKEFAKVQKQIHDKMNKYADKIIVGQYTGEKEPERKEGDLWQDRDGKQWTVKKGIKQSISPLQDAKTPWWCPECGKTMDKLDVKTFRVTSHCYDCVAKEESRLKMDGKWDDHREKKILENQIDWLKDRIVELTLYHDTLSNPEIQHFDHKTGAVLMVDKYSIPLDTVKKDIRAEVVGMNKSLKEKEKEYEEKHGELNGVVTTTQN